MMNILFRASYVYFLFFSLAKSVSGLNDYPIIGVFTQPSHSDDAACGGDCLYLAASYVKHVESGGARVVPINYYADFAELDILLESLNGFLFPGGGNDLPAAAQYVFNKTIAANDAGDYLPLFGICLGYEWLLMATSLNESVLNYPFDSENISLPLDFTSLSNTSDLYGSAPDSIISTLANNNVTMNVSKNLSYNYIAAEI